MANVPTPEAAIDLLHRLAETVGVERHWRDADGTEWTVADADLARVIAALGYPAHDAVSLADSLGRAIASQSALPRMVVGHVGLPTPIPLPDGVVDLIDETGAASPCVVTDGLLDAVAGPGYYRLVHGAQELQLAIAPARCPSVPGSERGKRVWGLAVQIPALRGQRDSAFGSLAELDEFARLAARRGADALAINPLHALLPGTGEDYSPYSPSSRLFLNGAMAAPELLGLPAVSTATGGDLIDWEQAVPGRLDGLRRVFAALDPQQRAANAAGGKQVGETLYRHALFDALCCRFGTRGAGGWHEWPAAYHDPAGPAVRAFAAEAADEVAFHQFVQWTLRGGLARIQRDACEGGMAIGLITDLAVGVRPGGSDTWALGDAMLSGLTIGAPPDPLGPLGQNWGLTGFSPQGLRDAAYAPWIAMLRAVLAHAGGVRIDHAFGLARLWVIPEGADCAQGAYLRYPFDDLLGLLVLEAHRAGAVVIAESLGTAPHGFDEAIAQRGLMGMDVLWFERAADHGFIGAQDYSANSVAMTSTHDTATVAGWWTGRDIDWAERLGRLPDGIDRDSAEAIRDWDRGLLWSTLDGGDPRPAPDDFDPVVDAAIYHVARSPAALAIVPLDDLAGEVEQPNLPGTVAVHPNWRRRFAEPIRHILDQPAVIRRLDRLNVRRRDRA